MLRLRNPVDAAAGLLFVAMALAGLYLGQDLRPGTSMRMGPGYLPRLLCWILLGFGALLLLRAFLTDGGHLPRWHPRPLILVLLSVLVFGLAIGPLGLVATSILVTAVAALASPESRPSEVAVLCLGLAAFSVGLFIEGLGLPMPTWPQALVR
ncbi:MAG TPA: tripartite tricarboxylate transporter TctB family protein [Azospirillaceae bacterium]|nr:tripartite tricarboxylate transporter TctB family protein [Azospirillaceae bacterium]